MKALRDSAPPGNGLTKDANSMRWFLFVFVTDEFLDKPEDDTKAALKRWVLKLQSEIGELKGFGTGENKYATRNLTRAVAGRFVTPAILQVMSLRELGEWYDVDNAKDQNLEKIAKACRSGWDTTLGVVGALYGIEAHHLCRLFCQLRGFKEAWLTQEAAGEIRRQVADFAAEHHGLQPTVGQYGTFARRAADAAAQRYVWRA